MKEQSPVNLLPIIMEVIMGKRKKLDIFGDKYNTCDGTCIRDYIHVVDLADAHFKAIKYLNDNTSQSTSINLSSGSGYSILEVVKMTEKVTGLKVPYSFKKYRKGDPASLIASNNLAKNCLQWRPRKSLYDIVNSMWKIYK